MVRAAGAFPADGKVLESKLGSVAPLSALAEDVPGPMRRQQPNLPPDWPTTVRGRDRVVTSPRDVPEAPFECVELDLASGNL